MTRSLLLETLYVLAEAPMGTTHLQDSLAKVRRMLQTSKPVDNAAGKIKEMYRQISKKFGPTPVLKMTRQLAEFAIKNPHRSAAVLSAMLAVYNSDKSGKVDSTAGQILRGSADMLSKAPLNQDDINRKRNEYMSARTKDKHATEIRNQRNQRHIAKAKGATFRNTAQQHQHDIQADRDRIIGNVMDSYQPRVD